MEIVEKITGLLRGNAEDPKIDPTLEIKESPETVHIPSDSSIPMNRQGEFPIEKFPEPIRRIAQELAEVYNVPVCLPALSCLAFLSGATGKQYVVTDAYRNTETYLNLYTILVVERGLGKGNIGDTLSKPILEVEKELRKEWESKCHKSRAKIEVLQENLRDAKRLAKDDDIPALNDMICFQQDIAEEQQRLESPPALIIDDTTSEALANCLATNGETLMSFSSEAGTLVKVALGKYNKDGDFDLLLHSYSGTSYKAERMGRKPIHLENPRLTTLWMVQKSVLESLLGSREAFERGLTARPLIVDTAARRTKDDGSEKVFTLGDVWAALLAPLLEGRKFSNPENEPGKIRCSGEAKEVFRAFHNESIELEESRYHGLNGECSRWRENAIKVAGLFQLIMDKNYMINEKTARAACAVVRWCGTGYMELLQGKRLEALQGDADKLVQICMRSGGEVSVGKLQANHGYRGKKIEHARYIARMFPDRLQFVTKDGPTKPSVVMTVVRLGRHGEKTVIPERYLQ